MDWLRSIFCKLLGIPVEQMHNVGQWQLGFRSFSWLGIVLIAATLLGVLSFLSYRRAGRHVPTVPKYLLAATRTLFLLLLLSLLLRPVLRFTLEGSVRRALLVLVDTSSSMATPEKRLDEQDLKRAEIAKDILDPSKGLDQPLEKSQAAGLESITRIDLVKAALQNKRMDLLNRLGKEYDIRPFTFGSATNEVGNVKGEEKNPNEVNTAFINKLTADAPVTPMGDAIRELLGRSRGQPLAGIFVMTDGQSNTGGSPTGVAEMAKLSDVPLYFYGVGLSTPKDIAVASIFSQDICFVDDEVPVVVRVRSTNLGGKTSKATLKLGEQTVDTKDVILGDTGEQVVSMQFTPKKPGEYELSASVDPVSEEANRENNADSKKIRVIDGKIKVLLAEQYPRWEFHYLQALLARDRRVQLKTYLAEADPALADVKDSPYLKTFPQTKAELIEKYDLVILGDLDPKGLSAAQMDGINEFVNKFGGGLITIAGRRGSPGTWKGTPLEKLLPVDLETVAGGGGRKPVRDSSDADKPIRLEVTPMGFDSPMLRLSDKSDESKRIWGKLPPIFWDATVTRAKPGASVYMVDPDPNKATRAGKMPVVAIQQYGLGQVLYVGTDNTWRWRKNAADKYHATLWGQMVQRLALPHLLGEAKFTQLSSDKKKYATGDKVTIYARLYKAPTYDPVTDENVTGSYESKDGRTHASLTLRKLPEQPGLYRGEFTAPEAGTFSFAVDRDRKEKLEINVEQPKLELGETALNEPLLKEMAAVTRGGYFREEDLSKMPDSMRLKTERVKSKLEVDVWCSPAYFVLLLLIVTAEWIGRKAMQLR
jgi:hypothetical protein